MSSKRKKSGSKEKLRRLNDFFSTLASDLDPSSVYSPPKVFALQRQRDRMRKRAEIENPALHKAALDDFVKLNDYVGERPLNIDPEIERHAKEFILHALEKTVKRWYPDTLQECFSTAWLLDNWRFGPGASNGVKGTGTVQKIDQPMTVTKRCEPLVRLLRMQDVHFQAIDCRNGTCGLALTSGSKLTTVLKNETAVRTIAIEPSGNMAIQLAGGLLIEEALRVVGLNIRTQQPKNQRLAREGSLDGSVSTEDLKSASDMQGLDLIERLWPSEWFSFFVKTRSPETVLPDGRVVVLNMVSTMGNGYTFPMMTLTISALIYALRARKGGPARYIDWTHTCVFGDDIIVPVYESEELREILRGCGYIVNNEKSYNSGPFRESCGGDYYEGYDVTPFYAKSLASYSDIYVVINQVLSWAAKHEIPCFRTLRYLFSLLDGKVHLVPEWLGDTQGVRCSMGPRRYKYLKARPVMVKYDGSCASKLAAGGYLISGKDGEMLYQPRTDWVKHVVKEAKLPSGYLDGWDPLTRSQRESANVNLYLTLAL